MESVLGNSKAGFCSFCFPTDTFISTNDFKSSPGGLSSVRRDFGESDSAPINTGELAVSAMLFHTCVHTWHGRTGVWMDLASFSS